LLDKSFAYINVNHKHSKTVTLLRQHLKGCDYHQLVHLRKILKAEAHFHIAENLIPRVLPHKFYKSVEAVQLDDSLMNKLSHNKMMHMKQLTAINQQKSTDDRRILCSLQTAEPNWVSMTAYKI
jgi:hypothetical protein